jgi:hypothetical protein
MQARGGRIKYGRLQHYTTISCLNKALCGLLQKYYQGMGS